MAPTRGLDHRRRAPGERLRIAARDSLGNAARAHGRADEAAQHADAGLRRIGQDVSHAGRISALQDLGFIIERANEPLGLVTGARFAEPNYYDVVGITVTVRTLSEKKTTIRANAIFNNEPITDPEIYRNFFATLERSLFIGRN